METLNIHRIFRQLRLVLASLFLFASIAHARSWQDHSGRLGLLSRQMDLGEKEIHALIERKRHVSDPKQVAELMRAIAEKHKALEKASSEYEEERQHVRFQHPEKNATLERSYVRHQMKSIDEMENDLGLDGRLDRIKMRVLSMFPVPEKKMSVDEKKFRTRLPASKTSIPDEEAPEKITLVK